MIDREELAQLIEAAFEDVPLPAHDDMFDAHDPMNEDFMEMVGDQGWRGLLTALKTTKSESLYGEVTLYLSFAGLKYFLQAWLIAMVTIPGPGEGIHWLSKILLPPTEGSEWHWCEFVRELTGDQKWVIDQVLEIRSEWRRPFSLFPQDSRYL